VPAAGKKLGRELGPAAGKKAGREYGPAARKKVGQELGTGGAKKLGSSQAGVGGFSHGELVRKFVGGSARHVSGGSRISILEPLLTLKGVRE
jgi:hypothetical protein